MVVKKVSLKEAEVLRVLSSGAADSGCFSFAGIASRSVATLTRKDIRRACRSLSRKGYAKFHRGLWNEDGEPRGSGYGATQAGRYLLEPYEG